MTDLMNSRGHRNELALVANLNELRGLTSELREELPHVNDARLHPTITTLVDAADVVFAAHGRNPTPTIADDLSILMSAVRALRIPLRDPDLDARTTTLERLRTSKGLIVAGLADALESAAALGLHPQKPPIPSDVAAALPRPEIEGLLQGILKRLTHVEKSLDALDETKLSPTSFAQQIGLLNFYVSSMRVEIDLAKLHMTVDDKTIDFNALARAVETMAGLTHDFVSTVRAWGGRVAEQVIEIAAEVPQRVRRVASGVKASARWMMRAVQRRGVPSDSRRSLEADAATIPVTHERPSDFSKDRARDMILRGKTPPESWVPFITELDFRRTKLRDLTPLKGLVGLTKLYILKTPIIDLAPLASLRNLEVLDLEETQVNDLTSFSGLGKLRWLDLQKTQVHDLAPLASLTKLARLNLVGTQVGDLTPLADLINLRKLDLKATQVSDLTPLAYLTNLVSLDLRGTRVSDVAPLARLVKLSELNLEATLVSDLTPIAGLTGLDTLNLSETQVSDLVPLVRLANLRTLNLDRTPVSDLAPLSGLTNLSNLRLRKTQIRDVRPLKYLHSLHSLDLYGTQVRDLTPVEHVAHATGPDGLALK